METLLVTGGCGFIGSNFISHVLATTTRYDVICVDALTYAGNVTNLDDVKEDDRLTMARVDIVDKHAIDRLFKGRAIDHVVNFAAESHVDRSIEDASIFLRTNILGVHCLLDAARAHGVKRFLQVSTDEVYGALGPDDPPFTEATPLHPNNPYSASKASADMLVQAYCNTHEFPAVITRCSNNYGPYQFPEKLIPVVISKIQRGEPIPVYGTGANVRDWIHVSDHCTGILAALERGKAGEVYNFGGNSETTNLNLVKRILSIMGEREELISFVKDRAGHDFRYAIDHAKATRDLGWEPRVVLDEGIKETVAWYQDHPHWIDSILSRAYVKENEDFHRRFKHVHEA